MVLNSKLDTTPFPHLPHTNPDIALWRKDRNHQIPQMLM